MYRSETEQMTQCAGCGAEVTPTDRAYAFGEEDVLCFECSEHRGGAYDEIHDRWQVAPKVDDLLSTATE